GPACGSPWWDRTGARSRAASWRRRPSGASRRQTTPSPVTRTCGNFWPGCGRKASFKPSGAGTKWAGRSPKGRGARPGYLRRPAALSADRHEEPASAEDLVSPVLTVGTGKGVDDPALAGRRHHKVDPGTGLARHHGHAPDAAVGAAEEEQLACPQFSWIHRYDMELVQHGAGGVRPNDGRLRRSSQEPHTGDRGPQGFHGHAGRIHAQLFNTVATCYPLQKLVDAHPAAPAVGHPLERLVADGVGDLGKGQGGLSHLAAFLLGQRAALQRGQAGIGLGQRDARQDCQRRQNQGTTSDLPSWTHAHRPRLLAAYRSLYRNGRSDRHLLAATFSAMAAATSSD